MVLSQFSEQFIVVQFGVETGNILVQRIIFPVPKAPNFVTVNCDWYEIDLCLRALAVLPFYSHFYIIIHIFPQ